MTTSARRSARREAPFHGPARRRGVTGAARAVDAHDLLLRRVHAAGEDAGLDGRRIAPRRARRPCARRAAAPPAAVRRPSSRPTTPTTSTRGAERRGIVRGVAGAAGHDLGRVVAEDQDRRLARDAIDLAVDELVGDQIADDDDRGRGRTGRARARARRAPRLTRSADDRSRRGSTTSPPSDVGRDVRRAPGIVPPRRAHRVVAVAGAHEHAARAHRRRRARRRWACRRSTNERGRSIANCAARLIAPSRRRACGSRSRRAAPHSALRMVRTVEPRRPRARRPPRGCAVMSRVHVAHEASSIEPEADARPGSW